MAKVGRKSTAAFSQSSDYLNDFIEGKRAAVEEAVTYKGAKKEWNKTIAEEQEDVSIETLLDDPYFLGRYKIWPAIKEELSEIWHLRCDYHVTFMRYEVPGIKESAKPIKRLNVYALSFEHALRKAKRLDEGHFLEADYLDLRRDRDLHTVCIETPKGTGKDFEMSLGVVLLTREFLIQNRIELTAPYELDPNTFLSINLTNRTETQAKSVTFREVLPKFNIPFFNDYFPPQISIDKIMEDRVFPSELRFPRNIVLFAGTSSASTSLGYTLISLVMDECNFMVKSESTSRGMSGGESYDAAQEIYKDTKERLFSRFSAFRNGKQTTPGLIFALSSTRTKRDFTARMERMAEMDPGIYFTSAPYWDRKPLPGLSGKTFSFDTRTMTILDRETVEAEYQTLDHVPQEIFDQE